MIVLCPKCRVQVKKDDLGELVCPNCNARLCPQAHIFDGKICTYCGWEDPNYYLWQKAQKARQKSPVSKKSDEAAIARLQYTCPKCGSNVDAVHKDCPICGFLGAKYQPAKATSAGVASAAARPAVSASPFLEKTPSAPPKKRIGAPARSPLLKEISKAERMKWEFPSLRRFVRPVLASLLVGAILGGLIMGGIYTARLISQSVGAGTSLLTPHLTSSKTTYILSTHAVPESGGFIKIVSPSSSNGTFEPGSQITLLAVPGDCYTFSYWDGDLSPSETATLTVDSNMSVTAHFQLKDKTPPDIPEVLVPKLSDTSATITWKTSEPATCQIYYGKTQDCDLPGPRSEELADSHNARLSALEANTTYYFNIRSLDACGNENISANKTFKTTRPVKIGHDIGMRAPDFTLPAYYDDNPESPNKGQTVSLSDFQGKKVLLNFWATSCGPCVTEFPFIRELYQDAQCNRNTGNVAVITIGIDNQPDRIKLIEDKYLSEYGRFTFPMLLDVEGATKKSYDIWRIPKTVFIDSDGIIREIKLGRFTSKEEIEASLSSID